MLPSIVEKGYHPFFRAALIETGEQFDHLGTVAAMFPGQNIYNMATSDGGHGRVTPDDKTVPGQGNGRLFQSQLHKSLCSRLKHLAVQDGHSRHHF